MTRINLLPEAKVTIIVEGLTEVTTITIPLASKPEYGVGPVWDMATGKETGEQHFGFSCYGLFDIDNNLHYSVKREER